MEKELAKEILSSILSETEKLIAIYTEQKEKLQQQIAAL